MSDKDVQLFREFQISPIRFISAMWGLSPQDRHEPFIKGKHITWQQVEILRAVERAIHKEAPNRISIASGHGTGKSATITWLMLWYLFCFKDCQVACTAPSAEQMNDVLWKEAMKWIQLMPEGIKEKFQWTTGHIRISESPETWFARAKTARKESPEALAGVHAEHVMLLVDEASGVPEEIYNTAEGSLTEENTLVILISNPTRLVGYFYDTHHREQDHWQTLQFSTIDSPLKSSKKYEEDIARKHGKDSDEFRIRVLGEFPNEESADDKGYLPLLSRNDIVYVEDNYDFKRAESTGKRLMIDPAGEGRDKTVWTMRDRFVLKRLGSESISTPKTIARKTMDYMDQYGIQPDNTFIDGYGIGGKVAQEIAVNPDYGRINVVLTGDKANDPDVYLNIRAESAFRLRKWLRDGGQFVNDPVWERELFLIRYKRNLAGKIQLMDKTTMKKLLHASPDNFDSVCLGFVRPDANANRQRQIKPQWTSYGRIKQSNASLVRQLR